MQSKLVPEGELIDVSPRPGTSLENVSEVVITVSSGRPIARP
jgi:beta-lactam-binding protein with PASTA domain